MQNLKHGLTFFACALAVAACTPVTVPPTIVSVPHETLQPNTPTPLPTAPAVAAIPTAVVNAGCSRIAFVAHPLDEFGTGDIYIVCYDGSDLQRLTDDKKNDNPAWSPDGQQLAFSSGRSGATQVYVMGANGDNVVQLTTEFENTQPVWLPDGEHIAFLTFDNGLFWWRMARLDGSDVIQLTEPIYDFFYQTPAWSPDGTRIAYMSLIEQAERNDGSSQIRVKNIDGTGDIALTSDIWSNVFPVWSPDSRRLAFLSERDGNYNRLALYVMDADGNNVKQLTQPIFDDQDWGYSWSPDGQWIVKSFSTPGNQSGGLYRINVETGEKLEVFRQPGELWVQKPVWQPGDPLAFSQYFSAEDALSTAYPVPTDIFSRHDDFGDGFIARIPVIDLQEADDEIIVKALVTRWLAHYQNSNQTAAIAIRGYTVDRIVFLDETLNPGYQIVAGVRFSIIPVQIPNIWASFSGEVIKPEDIWWHLSMAVGVFRDGDYYRLRLVTGWGT